jgi:hypothetical protein
MTITGTPTGFPQPLCCDPVDRPPLTSVPCKGANILSAPVSTVNGKPVLRRMRAVSCQAGQQIVIDWNLHDQTGNPVNLSDCVDPSELPSGSISKSEASFPDVSSISSEWWDAKFAVRFRFRDVIGMGSGTWWPTPDYTAKIVDPKTGQVHIEVTNKHTVFPGVYFAEIGLVGIEASGNEVLLFSNIFYLIVNRGLWGHTVGHPGGPPSIAEIRLHLRDSDASENYLLDNLKFDDAEIALAIQRPIEEWNETPPDVKRFTTRSFPYRFHWLEAICGNLFLMVGEQFRANHLRYSAAGVSIDDQDKEPNYEKAAATRLQKWREFMMRQKVSMNLSACHSSLGSPYYFEGAYYF